MPENNSKPSTSESVAPDAGKTENVDFYKQIDDTNIKEEEKLGENEKLIQEDTSTASNLADALNEGSIDASDAEDLFEKGEKKPGVSQKLREKDRKDVSVENIKGTPPSAGQSRGQEQVIASRQRREKAKKDSSLKNNNDLRSQGNPNIFREGQNAFLRSQLEDEQLTENQRRFKQASNPDVPIIGNFGQLGSTITRQGRDILTGENPRQSFKTIEEEFQIQGLGIVNQGQRLGDKVEESLEEKNVDTDIPVTSRIEEAAETGERLGIEESGNLADEIESAERKLVGGTATGGTAAGGIAVATPGASSELLRGSLQEAGLKSFQGTEATDIGEAAAGGIRITQDEFKENPVDFVASETGEEFAETAGGFLLAGPAGAAAAAAPTITPNINPEISTEKIGTIPGNVKNKAESFSLTNTRKGSARITPGTQPQVGPASTPGPGESTGPEILSDTIQQESTGRNIGTETILSDNTKTGTEVKTNTSTADTTGFDFTNNARIGALIENSVNSDFSSETVSRPETITENDPLTKGEPETSIVSEPENTVSVTTEAIPETVSQAEAVTQTKAEPETFIETETTPETTLEIDSGPSNEEENQGSPGIFSSGPEDREIDTTVAAEILGIEDEGKSKNPGNPLSLRLGF